MSISRRNLLLLLIGAALLITLAVVFSLNSRPGLASTDYPNASYSMNWQVVASGGTRMSSAHYRLYSTAGQSVIGYVTSAHYKLHSGFWYSFLNNNFLSIIVR